MTAQKSLIKRILVFDSGLGGLTVVSALNNTLHDISADIEMCYLADNEVFPYGKLGTSEVIKRVTTLIAEAKKRIDPDIIIIACNTASTTALTSLRNTFPNTSFIGVVPPIKPAGLQSSSRKIGLLATDVTAYGEYTNQLIESYAADCEFTIVADPGLAILAENKLCNRKLNQQALRHTLQPLTQKPDIDTVVLGCTHYPHILPEMQTILPHIKNWLNPAPAVARHLKTILNKQKHTPTILATEKQHKNTGLDRTVFLTKCNDPEKSIISALAKHRFSNITNLKIE